MRRENIVLNTRGGRIANLRSAGDAHDVRSPRGREPSFGVLLDGHAPGSPQGAGIEADARGLPRDGHLDPLVREHEVVRKTLATTLVEPGGERCAFTSA
jgi:hypothetical protein